VNIFALGIFMEYLNFKLEFTLELLLYRNLFFVVFSFNDNEAVCDSLFLCLSFYLSV